MEIGLILVFLLVYQMLSVSCNNDFCNRSLTCGRCYLDSPPCMLVRPIDLLETFTQRLCLYSHHPSTHLPIYPSVNQSVHPSIHGSYAPPWTLCATMDPMYHHGPLTCHMFHVQRRTALLPCYCIKLYFILRFVFCLLQRNKR